MCNCAKREALNVDLRRYAVSPEDRARLEQFGPADIVRDADGYRVTVDGITVGGPTLARVIAVLRAMNPELGEVVG